MNGFYQTPLNSSGENLDIVPKNGVVPSGVTPIMIPGWPGKATLVLSIDPSDQVTGWGNGETVTVDPLTIAWLEGNGKSYGLPNNQKFTGSGSGTTGFSPIDENIAATGLAGQQPLVKMGVRGFFTCSIRALLWILGRLTAESLWPRKFVECL